MKLRAAGFLACSLFAPCAVGTSSSDWIDLAGETVHTPREIEHLLAARALCADLDRGNGLLGQPSDETTIGCMAAQGFYLAGSNADATRPRGR